MAPVEQAGGLLSLVVDRREIGTRRGPVAPGGPRTGTGSAVGAHSRRDGGLTRPRRSVGRGRHLTKRPRAGSWVKRLWRVRPGSHRGSLSYGKKRQCELRLEREDRGQLNRPDSPARIAALTRKRTPVEMQLSSTSNEP